MQLPSLICLAPPPAPFAVPQEYRKCVLQKRKEPQQNVEGEHLLYRAIWDLRQKYRTQPESVPRAVVERMQAIVKEAAAKGVTVLGLASATVIRSVIVRP